MTAAGVCLLLAGLACFAAFSWGVTGHFRSTGRMPGGMILLSVLNLAGFAGFVARLHHPAALPAAAAMVLFAASLSLFGWTVRATHQTPPTLAFAADRPVFLLRHGPYRLVRHPFYLSYMLFWIATAMATPGVPPWLTPAVMALAYGIAATAEERKFARSDLAGAYAAYRTRAGMFWPRVAGR